MERSKNHRLSTEECLVLSKCTPDCNNCKVVLDILWGPKLSPESLAERSRNRQLLRCPEEIDNIRVIQPISNRAC